MKKSRKHPIWIALLYIAAAVALAIAPWAVSGVQAGGQGWSGSPRPLMPGNQPAGTSLNQPTPGSTMGVNARQAAPPALFPAPNPAPATSVSPAGSSSTMPAQGAVKGRLGAPSAFGDPAGGSDRSRGGKGSGDR